MKNRVFALIFIGLLTTGGLIAQPEKLQTGKWITEWRLLGPIPLDKSDVQAVHLPGFEKDYLKKFGGETNPDLKPEGRVKIKGNTLKWVACQSKDSIVNLDEAVSNKTYVAAYAFKEIYSDKASTYILSFGTNDGGRLWVNGVLSWDFPGGRGLTPDADQVPVYLKKGKNSILLKVEERGNSWGFCMRIMPFDVNVFTNTGKLFKVITLEDGNPELRFGLAESVADKLFKSVDLKLYQKEGGSQTPVWSAAWNRKIRMPVRVTDMNYKPYVLKLEAILSDGQPWSKEITFFAGERKKYTLFHEKRTNYRIVVGRDASESEQWAASELQKYLKEISGADFDIADDSGELSDNEIIIGYNRHALKVLEDGFTPPPALDETYVYKNFGPHILLAGGSQRGSMYAVFSFLEDVFGVRWYTPRVTKVSRRGEFSFDYFHHSETPSVKVRNDFYYEAFDPDWAAHNKMNGAMGYRKQHGGIEGYWAVHTFYQFMPPEEFYKKHPEYYSLINGERIYDHAQLCLTNPDVLDIITERLKKAMSENPENLIYSVSQNDWRNPCQCDQCKTIVKREGSEAGIIVWFVNKVAEKIKDEFPDKYVGTLAYQYTRTPPKSIKPAENVVIRLCSIECCFAHDFKSCPENQAFLADLEGWAAISPHLYIWDYVVNFSHYIMPYPNFKVLKPNITTFKENKAIGIMEQAAYQSRGGEFAELRMWVIAKLLWDDGENTDKLIDDFMYGYYGRSGQYVREYFDLLHDQVTPDTHIHLGLKPDDKLFTEEFIRQADVIFDKAEAVADDEAVKARVEMARLPLMYLKCMRDPLNARYDGTYRRFSEIVEREGITHLAERGKPHTDDFHMHVKSAE